MSFNPPNWITPVSWRNGFIRLTTPNSNGNLMTGSTSHGATITMQPPAAGGISPGDCSAVSNVGCNQSWHFDGENVFEARPTWRTSFNISYDVGSSDCGDDPLRIQVAGSSDERTSYDYNTGLMKHSNSQHPTACTQPLGPCPNNCPYLDAYVCATASGQLFQELDQNQALNNPGCKWINQDTIKDCCLLPKGAVSPTSFPQCYPSYSPGTGGYCVDYMTNFCSGNWLTQPECNFYIKNYIANYGDVSAVIQNTIKNYVNSPSRTPHDYVSSRDSNDPFFTQTIPFLCGTVPGSGNDILRQLCAEFTRDDLKADQTLQNICGCFLSDGTPPPNAGLELSNPPAPNQYIYPFITRECDPLCRYAGTVQWAQRDPNTNNWSSVQCTSSLCMLNDVNVTQINSEGDFNINLYCGNCSGGSCTCVIDDVIVNEINSQGKINISQNCGSCFTVNNNNPSSPTPINCSTLSPNPPSDSLWLSIKRFLSRHRLSILVSSLILFALLGGGGIFLLIRKRKK